MSAKRVTSTAQLLRASSDDEHALTFPLHDSSFGFHAQQAVEKLYKALLAHRHGTYPFSHDLASLRRRVQDDGVVLPIAQFRLETLAEYAGEARYDEPIPLDEQTRELLRAEIRVLREFVLEQIS